MDVPGNSSSFLSKRSRTDSFDETNIDAACKSLREAGLVDAGGCSGKVTPPANWRNLVAEKLTRRSQVAAEMKLAGQI